MEYGPRVRRNPIRGSLRSTPHLLEERFRRSPRREREPATPQRLLGLVAHCWPAAYRAASRLRMVPLGPTSSGLRSLQLDVRGPRW